jgi:hypothetical protein
MQLAAMFATVLTVTAVAVVGTLLIAGVLFVYEVLKGE